MKVLPLTIERASFLIPRLRAEDGKAQAIAEVRGELGARVPDDTELVDADTVIQEVLSVAPRKVTAPVVLATNAG